MVTPFAPTSATDRDRRRRRTAVLLLVAAALVAGAALVGRADPGRSLVVHELLDHPFLLGVVAYALFAAGVAGLLGDPVRRIAVGVLLAGVGATAFGLAGLVVSAHTSPDRSVRTVPGPVGSPFEAVVDDDGGQGHRVARVTVQDRAWSAGAHRTEVACVSTTQGRQGVLDVRWTGPRSLVVELAGDGTHTLTLDDTGAPTAPLRRGLLCG